MFSPTNILVYRQPTGGFLWIKCPILVFGITERAKYHDDSKTYQTYRSPAWQVPDTADGIRVSTTGDAPAGFPDDQSPVIREGDRQVLIRDRNNAANLAMNDRDRAAPVSLPRDTPVPQTILDVRRLGRLTQHTAARASGPAIEEVRIHQNTIPGPRHHRLQERRQNHRLHLEYDDCTLEGDIAQSPNLVGPDPNTAPVPYSIRTKLATYTGTRRTGSRDDRLRPVCKPSSQQSQWPPQRCQTRTLFDKGR